MTPDQNVIVFLSLTNTVFGPLCGLRTTCLSAENSYKNKQNDRPGYSNKHNGKHPHASQEKKRKKKEEKSHVQHTNTHTQIFSNSPVTFLTHRSCKSGHKKNHYVMDLPPTSMILSGGFESEEAASCLCSSPTCWRREETSKKLPIHVHSARTTHRHNPKERRGVHSFISRNAHDIGSWGFVSTILMKHSCFAQDKTVWVCTYHSRINDEVKTLPGK